MTTDLYAALDRGLAHTTDLDDALFIDREGRLRTNPVRKPPPGGKPAHLAALLEVLELAANDEPLHAALDAGMVRIRTVRCRGNAPVLSLTASVPLTSAQSDRLRRIVDGESALQLDGKFAGEPIASIESLPVAG